MSQAPEQAVADEAEKAQGLADAPKVFFDIVDAFGNVHGQLAMARKDDATFEMIGIVLAGNSFNLRLQEQSKAIAGAEVASNG